MLFFFFSSLNRSACVQGVPCERPWGVLSRRAAGGGSFPLALGPWGRPAARGWVLSCSTDAALCLCMGRTTFWSGEEAVLALTNVSCPRTSLHTPRPDYIHSIYTHTLARGDKERATVPLRIARQCHGNKKKPQTTATSERLTRVSLAGLSVCFSEVELGDGPLAAALCQLVGDALAVALQLGEVLVEDFARAQG